MKPSARLNAQLQQPDGRSLLRRRVGTAGAQEVVHLIDVLIAHERML